MAYLLGLGHSIALVDLVAIVPQPRSPEGVQAAERDFGADGMVYERGLFIPLQWSSLGSVSAYQSLLAQFDLDDFLSKSVTIYAPNFEREWHRYNGYAIRPTSSNYAIFPRSIVIVVNRLVQIG